ncbi:hypothetical protein GCM10007140_35590 [Priestia taiwanensis]|uniref:Uncharacterized protein n=1 Tax=Priestia taiwanensis TaxID=1347902 RepID=A0A917AWG5_9BACI|nr:hypothetical protein GCM10007140_35590 [Priestia taiwanensis]
MDKKEEEKELLLFDKSVFLRLKTVREIKGLIWKESMPATIIL